MIKIMIVDDEHLIRDSIASLLGLSDEIEVVATASSGAEALDLVEQHHPDVVITDLQMPGMSGVDLAVTLQADYAIPTVIITSHALPGLMETIVIKGIRGVLPKAVTAAALIEAISRVKNGETYIDPGFAFETMLTGLNPLSPEEREVLKLTSQGATYEEMAKQLRVKEDTVLARLKRAAEKLGARNLLGAIHTAQTNGWI